jgi:hypothetical protein
VRGEEIEARFSALLGRLRKAHLGPARAQVYQWKSLPAVARLKYDWPPADLARIPPQLRCAPADLERRHSDWADRRHRASDRTVILLELSSRASFALSTALPTFGGAMLDPLSAVPGPVTARHAAEGTREAG